MRTLPIALLLFGALNNTAYADSQRPSTVSNVRANAISANAIRLSWKTPWDNVGVDGFNIYRNGDYYNTVFNTTNYIDINLSPDTRYEYAVVAFDKARNYSTLSTRSAATTNESDDTTGGVTGAAPPSNDGTPAAPSNLSAEVLGTNKIHLEWKAPDGTVSGYNLYQDGHYVKTVKGSTNYTVSSLSADREYSWQIVAFNGRRFSAKSDKVRATTDSEEATSTAKEPDERSSTVPKGYKLAFSDEFRSEKLNSANWTSRYRWGPEWTINNELQYYVDILNAPDFAQSPFLFDGENLTISATKTPDNLKSQANNQPYLSAAMTTYGKFKMRYGYVEMRARLPKGKGMWPAFWLLHNQEDGIRPEIDVVELLGDRPEVVYQTYHYYNNWQLQSTPSYQVWGDDFSADFHTYGMLWEPGSITWYVDGEARNSFAHNNVAAEDMYLLVNLAIGGNWAGQPDDTTPLPANYTIDYIRAYTPD